MKPTTGRISVFTGRIAILLDISAFLPLVGGLLCVLWHKTNECNFYSVRDYSPYHTAIHIIIRSLEEYNYLGFIRCNKILLKRKIMFRSHNQTRNVE